MPRSWPQQHTMGVEHHSQYGLAVSASGGIQPVPRRHAHVIWPEGGCVAQRLGSLGQRARHQRWQTSLPDIGGVEHDKVAFPLQVVSKLQTVHAPGGRASTPTVVHRGKLLRCYDTAELCAYA